eukprot:TRINITY_DN2046_c0_g1_i1.p2 TRINITY_DN2046_c0_g1~~TRINITY_DN2046_c0_g1_i1.p2  ORF type:complete len:186 (+),score=25.02 TRINITY_DN2046_c0_g1_i1:749-1306(+)
MPQLQSFRPAVDHLYLSMILLASSKGSSALVAELLPELPPPPLVDQYWKAKYATPATTTREKNVERILERTLHTISPPTTTMPTFAIGFGTVLGTNSAADSTTSFPALKPNSTTFSNVPRSAQMSSPPRLGRSEAPVCFLPAHDDEKKLSPEVPEIYLCALNCKGRRWHEGAIAEHLPLEEDEPP